MSTYHKRQREYEEVDKDKARRNIVYPEYREDTRISAHRLINIPPKELFEPLGWDRDPHTQMVEE